LMGQMTLAYGAAQIVAPALTGMLAEASGHYYVGLWLAGGFVGPGRCCWRGCAEWIKPPSG